MQAKQLNAETFAVNLELDGNLVCFAQNLSRSDAEKVAIEVSKTVTGEVEIVPSEIPVISELVCPHRA